MLFKAEKDWKQLLAPEDEEKMNDILRRAARYRGAYKNASEVKIAQLWAAVLELYKQNLILQSRLDDMSDVFESIAAKLRKKEEEKQELIKSLERF